jgi:putative phosphoribosyl transferase
MFSYNIDHAISIPSETNYLKGILYIPNNASSLVLFVHGSGSSRFSTRNHIVAQQLNESCIATLLFDLLTPEEEQVDAITREFRFDIDLLASRLMDATKWCQLQTTLLPLKIGYFGASTGGGAALVAAANLPDVVHAVVSRGGRPDLAAESLNHVLSPTLLIVGGLDDMVIELNQTAYSHMNCVKKLEIIPGATHLFEEAGTLNEVSRHAIEWFVKYLK